MISTGKQPSWKQKCANGFFLCIIIAITWGSSD